MNDDMVVLLAQLEMEYMPGSNTLSLRKKAASAIRALVEENERLREEVRTTDRYNGELGLSAANDVIRIAALEAKLREAVEVVQRAKNALAAARHIYLKYSPNGSWTAGYEADLQAAKAFLATMEKPRDP